VTEKWKGLSILDLRGFYPPSNNVRMIESVMWDIERSWVGRENPYKKFFRTLEDRSLNVRIFLKFILKKKSGMLGVCPNGFRQRSWPGYIEEFWTLCSTEGEGVVFDMMNGCYLSNKNRSMELVIIMIRV